MSETAAPRLRKSADALKAIDDCHASVVAARLTLERAERALRRASRHVARDDKLRTLRGFRRPH